MRDDTVQPIWVGVLGRHRDTTCAAYADDAYLMGAFEPTLTVFAAARRTFKQDADLDVRLPKCKIYMPDVTEERARYYITQCIKQDSTGLLAPFLHMMLQDLDFFMQDKASESLAQHMATPTVSGGGRIGRGSHGSVVSHEPSKRNHPLESVVASRKDHMLRGNGRKHSARKGMSCS